MTVHLFNIRVYSEDTDYSGVVYHAQYLCFMSRARSEWLRERGGRTLDDFERERCAFVVRAAQLKYHRPSRLGDLLVVETRIAEMRRASFMVAHRIWVADKPSEIICDGTVELVFVDFNLRPRALPKELMAEINCGS